MSTNIQDPDADADLVFHNQMHPLLFMLQMSILVTVVPVRMVVLVFEQDTHSLGHAPVFQDTLETYAKQVAN